MSTFLLNHAHLFVVVSLGVLLLDTASFLVPCLALAQQNVMAQLAEACPI